MRPNAQPSTRPTTIASTDTWTVYTAPRTSNGTLSTISRKSNTLTQRRPRVGQRDVGLAQPLLLQRLEAAVLLELADLPVDVLQQRGVALAHHSTVVGLG